MKKTQFKIVVPSYQSTKWLPRTLESIEQQTYTHYDVCVIDDASPDSLQAEIVHEFTNKNGWLPLYNPTRKRALVNVMAGISQLNCQDQDVILVVDGDDWLFNKGVLQFLAGVYANPEVWLTYSQFLRFESGRVGDNAPNPKSVVRKGAYREYGWFYYQLRAFRYNLWKKIRDEDLRDPSGEYFKISYDGAIMYPMLEMAGKHHRFIPDVLYVYNDAHSLNDHQVAPKAQQVASNFIRSKPKYEPLDARF